MKRRSIWVAFFITATNQIDQKCVYINMIRPLLISLPLILLSFWATAQDNEYSEKYRKWKKQYSADCITDLKGGALFVRLHTRNTAVQLYLKNGQDKIAERIMQEQFTENRAIMQAFKEEFNFCDVYFFFSDDTKAVTSGKAGHFLNAKLKKDTSIHCNSSFFMVAEYSALKKESFVVPGDEPKNQAPAGGNAIERALVMKDSTLMQMPPPFPYYVSAVFEKQINNQVKKLNERLKTYYNHVN